jgi:hypothetical protein
MRFEQCVLCLVVGGFVGGEKLEVALLGWLDLGSVVGFWAGLGLAVKKMWLGYRVGGGVCSFLGTTCYFAMNEKRGRSR